MAKSRIVKVIDKIIDDKTNKVNGMPSDLSGHVFEDGGDDRFGETITWYESSYEYSGDRGIIGITPDEFWRVNAIIREDTVDAVEEHFSKWLERNRRYRYAIDVYSNFARTVRINIRCPGTTLSVYRDSSQITSRSTSVNTNIAVPQGWTTVHFYLTSQKWLQNDGNQDESRLLSVDTVGFDHTRPPTYNSRTAPTWRPDSAGGALTSDTLDPINGAAYVTSWWLVNNDPTIVGYNVYRQVDTPIDAISSAAPAGASTTGAIYVTGTSADGGATGDYRLFDTIYITTGIISDAILASGGTLTGGNVYGQIFLINRTIDSTATTGDAATYTTRLYCQRDDSTSAMDFSGTPSSGGYIYIKNYSNIATVQRTQNMSPGSYTRYTDTNVRNGYEYFYTLDNIYSDGELSDKATIQSITAGDTVAPDDPIGVMATINTNTKFAHLEWYLSTAATARDTSYFNIYSTNVPTGAYPAATTANFIASVLRKRGDWAVNGTPYGILHAYSYELTTAFLSTGTYAWRVTAVDAADNESSGAVDDFVLSPPDPITAISGALVNRTPEHNGEITLTWDVHLTVTPPDTTPMNNREISAFDVYERFGTTASDDQDALTSADFVFRSPWNGHGFPRNGSVPDVEFKFSRGQSSGTNEEGTFGTRTYWVQCVTDENIASTTGGLSYALSDDITPPEEPVNVTGSVERVARHGMPVFVASVNLEWDTPNYTLANSDLVGFNIYEDAIDYAHLIEFVPWEYPDYPLSASPPRRYHVSTVFTTGWTDPYVHTYYIASKDEAGNTSASSGFVVSTLTDPLDPIDGITGALNRRDYMYMQSMDQQVYVWEISLKIDPPDLTIERNSLLKGFNVYKDTTGAGGFVYFYPWDVSSGYGGANPYFTFIDGEETGVSYGTHTFYVTCVDRFDIESTTGGLSALITDDTTPPETPVDLNGSVTYFQFSDNVQVNLDWVASTAIDCTHYVVSAGSTSFFVPQPTKNTNGNRVFFNFTTGRFFYLVPSVVAVDDAGNNSGAAEVTLPGNITAPEAPSGLNADFDPNMIFQNHNGEIVDKGTARIDMYWLPPQYTTANADLAGFYLYEDTFEGGPLMVINWSYPPEGYSPNNNIIKNQSFENGTTPPWISSGGTPVADYSPDLIAATGYSYDGSWAMRCQFPAASIDNKKGWMQQSLTGYYASTTYQFSCWVSTTTGYTNNFLGANIDFDIEEFSGADYTGSLGVTTIVSGTLSSANGPWQHYLGQFVSNASAGSAIIQSPKVVTYDGSSHVLGQTNKLIVDKIELIPLTQPYSNIYMSSGVNGDNLIVNSDFEDATSDPWVSGGEVGTTVAASSDAAYDGTYSMLLLGSNNPNKWIWAETVVSAGFTPDTDYIFECYIQPSPESSGFVGHGIQFRIEEYDATSALISDALITCAVMNTANWQKYTGTYHSSIGAAYIIFVAGKARPAWAGAVNSKLYFDNVSFYAVSDTLPYLSTTFTREWNEYFDHTYYMSSFDNGYNESPSSSGIRISNDSTAPGSVTELNVYILQDNRLSIPGDYSSGGIIIQTVYTNPTDLDFSHVNIYEDTTGSADAIITQTFGQAGTRVTTQFSLPRWDGSKTLWFTSVDKVGNESSGVYRTGSIDTTAPGEATNLTGFNVRHTVVLQWTNPTDTDFHACNIYRDDLAGDPVGSVIFMTGEGITTGSSGTYLDPRPDLIYGNNYQYYVTTLDNVGNESAGVGYVVSAIGPLYSELTMPDDGILTSDGTIYINDDNYWTSTNFHLQSTSAGETTSLEFDSVNNRIRLWQGATDADIKMIDFGPVGLLVSAGVGEVGTANKTVGLISYSDPNIAEARFRTTQGASPTSYVPYLSLKRTWAQVDSSVPLISGSNLAGQYDIVMNNWDVNEAGDLTIGGDLGVSGSIVWSGVAGSPTIAHDGVDFTFSDSLSVVGNINPQTTDLYDLGTSAQRWGQIHINTSAVIYGGAVTGKIGVLNTPIYMMTLYANTQSGNSYIAFDNDAGGTLAGFIPANDGITNLGRTSGANRFKNAWFTSELKAALDGTHSYEVSFENAKWLKMPNFGISDDLPASPSDSVACVKQWATSSAFVIYHNGAWRRIGASW